MDQQPASTPEAASAADQPEPSQSAADAPARAEPTSTGPTAGERPSGEAASAGGDAPSPGFRTRGRARRRVRFLRKARELAYRDLGGLVFNLHRFGQRNDALVMAKLNALGEVDSELRALEAALEERQNVTVLHEAGVTACPRCAAIHSGEDRFCPSCGLPRSKHVDLPIGSAPGASAAMPAGSSPAGAPAPPTPAGIPAPAGPAAGQGAPAAAAARASKTPVASTRAQAPPAGPAPAASPRPSNGPPSARPSAPATAAPEEEQPTEILRPPAAST